MRGVTVSDSVSSLSPASWAAPVPRQKDRSRAVETHFKKPRFLGFLRKPKNPEKLGI